MKNAFNPNTLSETIEQSPLSDLASQELFAEWCQINDSILPQFLPRKEWEKLDKKQILQQKQGKLLLLLPQDLQLWEMMEIIRKIDQNTFKNKPEKHNERADELSELGRKFEKAGLYLANYFPLENNSEEAKLAQDLAQQFYSYGCSLQQQEKKSDSLPQKFSLSEEERSEIDQRLLGREAYAKRLARLGEVPSKEQLDSMRKELLTTAFKALTRAGSKEQGEKPRELKKGPYYQLQEKVQEQLLKAVQTPETELYSAIFRRGKEKLLNEMPAPKLQEQIGLVNKLKNDIPKLIDVLQIDQLKAELDTVRKTGNIKLISKKELAIAKKIQKVVSSLKAQQLGNNPSEMIETGEINCVGSALLGGALLEDFGITSLAASLPEHASTILITSDGRWYRQDFTPGTKDWKANYIEILPDMLENKKERAKIQNKKEGFLIFKKWNPYHFIKGKLNVYMGNREETIQSFMFNNMGIFDRSRAQLSPEKIYKQALKIHPNNESAYHNLGIVLLNLGRYKEAIEHYQKVLEYDVNNERIYNNLGVVFSNLRDYAKAVLSYQKALEIDPNNESVYNLGIALSILGRYEEAVKLYKKSLKHNPNSEKAYNNLGIVLSKQGKYEKAIQLYQKALEINPNNKDIHYNLGTALGKLRKYAEAIGAYQKFIQLADPEDKDWIEKAEEEIQKFQKKRNEKSE